MPQVTEAQVLDALKNVLDPDLNRDIVALGFVKNVRISGGQVAFDIELTTPACPVKDSLKQQAYDSVKALPGVEQLEISMTAQTRGRSVISSENLRGVKNIIAVGSGKGGVGKSTATVNLALALQATGATVGILDADVYGPSIPAMMGTAERPRIDDRGQAVPPVAHGVKIMSVAMLVGDDAPAIWRGPIASRMLQSFIGAVNWGELDYLLMDLPPGTGDVQLTLAQSATINGAVIVTTPQDVSLRIAKKGLRMFDAVQIPVLGIIENMAGFVCPNCNTLHHIFRSGGGERIARELNLPLLGSVPLDPRMVEAGDLGQPLVMLDKDSPGAKAFAAIARSMAARLSVSNINEQKRNHAREVHLTDRNPPSIVWDDGAELAYDHRTLRLACPCAECRNEISGECQLEESRIRPDIKVVEAKPVGRYGLNLIFNDGHGSGIYVGELLRSLGTPV